MKKFIILFALIVGVATIVDAQLTLKDGKYYDQGDKLYTGVYTEYYESGSKKIEMNVVDGEKNGITKIYFENQKLNEVRMFNHIHSATSSHSIPSSAIPLQSPPHLPSQYTPSLSLC